MLYNSKDGQRLLKLRGTQHEVDMMLAAGDCSVSPYERVVFGRPDGTLQMWGFTMPRETPLEVAAAADPTQRAALMQRMIRTLNGKGIVHGDIKLANMLLCSDGKVRLCDFAEARFLNEDPANWEGLTTTNYVSPNRCQTWPGSQDPPPVLEDDLYALGLSIWEMYTGRVPFDGIYEDDIREMIKAGKTVDVSEVKDEAIQEVISKYLRCGGARI